jgi:addiction module RelB/DinJ family antitoxin
MSDKVLVQARVDADIKIAAENILAQYGLDLPSLFRMVLHATVRAKGVPFPTSPESISSEDFNDWLVADKAHKEFQNSGAEPNSISKIYDDYGV